MSDIKIIQDIDLYFQKHLTLPTLNYVQKRFPSHGKEYIKRILRKHFSQYYFGRRHILLRKRNIPMTTTPWLASVDLAFLSRPKTDPSQKKNIIGMFLIAINLFTNEIGLVKISSKKSNALLKAFMVILQKKPFQHTKTFYSDKEAAISSKVFKDKIKNKYDVTIVTSSTFKRYKVERSILTVKNLFRKRALVLNKSLFAIFMKDIGLIEKVFNENYTTQKPFKSQLDLFFNRKRFKKIIQIPGYVYEFELGELVHLYRSALEKNSSFFKYTRDSYIKVCMTYCV